MPRRAFTLIELIAVIAIIAVLSALIWAGVGSAKRSAQRNTARALVGAVTAAITSYGARSLTIYADGSTAPVAARAWDVDKDAILDGEVEPPVFLAAAPAASVPGSGPERERLRYRGFAAMAAPPGLNAIDAGGRILDPWKRPLHIAWAAGIYGDEGFNVWSLGELADDPKDDIHSRELR